jgi:peptidoglycan/LPS O-acetylase OafA/YrhL
LIFGLPQYSLGAYTLTFCRMDALVLGAALALEARTPTGEGGRGALALGSRRVVAPAMVLLIVSQVFLRLHVEGAETLGSVFLPTLWAFIFAGLISKTLVDGPIKRCFDRPGLRFLGRYSYGIYIFHSPLRQLLEKLAPPGKLAVVLHSVLAAWLVFMLVGFTVATGAAWTSFHLFEARFMALKSRFEPRREAVTGTGAA